MRVRTGISRRVSGSVRLRSAETQTISRGLGASSARPPPPSAGHVEKRLESQREHRSRGQLDVFTLAGNDSSPRPQPHADQGSLRSPEDPPPPPPPGRPHAPPPAP